MLGRLRALLLQPGIQTVGGRAQPTGDLGDAVATIRDLRNRFSLEFLGVSLTAHEHLSFSHIEWLGGV